MADKRQRALSELTVRSNGHKPGGCSMFITLFHVNRKLGTVWTPGSFSIRSGEGFLGFNLHVLTIPGNYWGI